MFSKTMSCLIFQSIYKLKFTFQESRYKSLYIIYQVAKVEKQYSTYYNFLITVKQSLFSIIFEISWCAYSCRPLRIAQVSMVSRLETSFSIKLASIMISPLLFLRMIPILAFCWLKNMAPSIFDLRQSSAGGVQLHLY